tara:strand:- start:6455 stop:6985 length:531 start_codon:yes stop_codon:yes gene_type:complete
MRFLILFCLFVFVCAVPLSAPFSVRLFHVKDCDVSVVTSILKQTRWINDIPCLGFRFYYDSSPYAPGLIECGPIADPRTLGWARSDVRDPTFKITLDIDKISRFSVSLENTILHELGHVVGLNHNEQDETSIMYPSVRGLNSSFFSLTDLSEMRRLYPLCSPVRDERFIPYFSWFF